MSKGPYGLMYMARFGSCVVCAGSQLHVKADPSHSDGASAAENYVIAPIVYAYT
jgi:hypothetical protein